MKRTPLLFAAMVPMIAVAAPSSAANEAYEKLKRDVAVTQIMGSEVENRDGEGVGEVEDVVLGSDGEIQSILVDRNSANRRTAVAEVQRDSEGREYAGVWGEQDKDRMKRLATTEWAREDQNRMPRMGTRDDENLEKTAGYDSEGHDEPRNIEFQWDEEAGYVGSLTEIDWQDAEFDADNQRVSVNRDVDFERATYRDDEDLTETGEFRATEVIGMEVNLLDDDSFGEVEDILVSRDGNQATAYVVDSMDYADKETYALPAQFEATSAEFDEVNYAFTSQEVEELGEFDIEDVRD